MVTVSPEDAGALELRLSRLARVTAELASARDASSVTDIVVSHAAEAVGAAVASLSLLTDPETLTLVGLSGARPGTEQRWATFPLNAQLPASEAVRRRERIILSGLAEMEQRYPALAGQAPEERSVVCLPLIVGDRCLGSIALAFSGARTPDHQELEFLSTLADAAAQALDRAAALKDAREAAEKLRFLADSSVEMAASLDYRTTLANVARLAVPTLADWCAVEILEDGKLTTLAVAHTDPAKVELAKELQRRYPTDPDSPSGAPNVARTGKSELYPKITDEMIVARAEDEEHLRLLRELNLCGGLVVPLATQGRTLGVMSLVSAESGRIYSEADVALAEDVARRAATAIDNSHLHSETKDAALLLQKAVLPDALPVVHGWEMEVHYAPSGRTEVGGDFYDALALADGRLAVLVGDVMGRGVQAAAAMAQMRAASRAYIAIDDDPTAVAQNLDRMFSKFTMDQFVTLVYLVADQERNEITMVNAGHLPPIIVRSDGQATLVESRSSAAFSIGPDDRTATRLSFGSGDTLLVYTDGLIERRSEAMPDSFARLLAHASALRSGDLSSQLSEMILAVHDEEREDDITALALRRV